MVCALSTHFQNTPDLVQKIWMCVSPPLPGKHLVGKEFILLPAEPSGYSTQLGTEDSLDKCLCNQIRWMNNWAMRYICKRIHFLNTFSLILNDKMTFDSFPLKPHGQCLPSSLVSSHFIFWRYPSIENILKRGHIAFMASGYT